MLKKILKWAAIVIVLVAAAGLLAFLYFIPPFNSTTPEQYVKDAAAMALPSLDNVKDPVQRAMAERGRYIVMTTGCSDCHSTPGPQGPRADMYMAGGMKIGVREGGSAVTRNLTSDPETGLGNVKDEEVLRVLRSGVFHDGRAIIYRQMPWAAFANWTEEDRRAVLAYLRALKPIKHRIPDPVAGEQIPDLNGAEAFYGADFGSTPDAKK